MRRSRNGKASTPLEWKEIQKSCAGNCAYVETEAVDGPVKTIGGEIEIKAKKFMINFNK